MEIVEKLLPFNAFSRPGRTLEGVKGIVIHWVGGYGQTAQSVRDFFASLAIHNPNKNYASTQFAIGCAGEILRIIPEYEAAYHVGAQPHEYTPRAREKLGAWPNGCTLGIELCHPDMSGRFTSATLDSAAWLTNHLLDKYGLARNDVYRHYDVTGKLCPKFFAENENEWQKFLERLGG